MVEHSIGEVSDHGQVTEVLTTLLRTRLRYQTIEKGLRPSLPTAMAGGRTDHAGEPMFQPQGLDKGKIEAMLSTRSSPRPTLATWLGWRHSGGVMSSSQAVAVAWTSNEGGVLVRLLLHKSKEKDGEQHGTKDNLE